MVRRKTQILKILRRYIAEIEKIFYIDSVYLFGSYAKKNRKREDSDIDIAVVSKDFVYIEKFLAMKILSKLTWDIDTRIEAIPITPDDLIDPGIGSIEYSILKEGKLIYLRH